MSRPFALILRSILLVLATACVAVAEKPNIVIYLSDDHSQFDCGLYGAEDIPTPNFQQLANDGMVFSRAFVASPSCAPSRAAMLTGLMPARNGAEANHTYPPAGTHYLVEDLKAAGYEVVAFGKVGHGNNQQQFGFELVSPGASYENLRKDVGKFLQDRKSDKPLCLFAGISNPHVPWSEKSSFDPASVKFPPTHLDTPSTRIHRAAYYQEIKEVDLLMGELREMADKYLGKNTLFIHSSDHGSQWPFGKWTLYDYGTRVPFLVAWPGVIKPNSKSDAMISWVDLLPTVLDLVGANTPQDLDGKSFAGILKGESNSHRTRIFTTTSGDGPVNVYPIRAVRTDQWKLIHNLHPEFAFTNHSDLHRKPLAGAYWTEWAELAKTDERAKQIVDRYYRRPEWELYRVDQDKWEQQNLIDDPANAKIVAELKTELADWMKSQGDKQTVFNKPRPLDQPETWHPDYDNRQKPDPSTNPGKNKLKQVGSKRPVDSIATIIPDDQWKPKPTPISTRWDKEVTPENAWTEYPRPQLVRANWTNLNGLWDYAVARRDLPKAPEKFDGKILVPFSIESPLSGVAREVNEDEAIWYRRSFAAPESEGKRTLLHFEASDWQTTVWVNDKKVGMHEGGYAPFSFDITDALAPGTSNTLAVKVWDPQTKNFKSLGKQKAAPKAYQRCSGIWQTVWLEPVPQVYVAGLKINATAKGNIEITPEIANPTKNTSIAYEILDGEKSVSKNDFISLETAKFSLENPKTWSPDSPFLYDLKVTLKEGDQVVDSATSYLGLRTIELGWTDSGTQIFLNGEPIFQFGPLDQNYWPGSGLTPPSDAAMRWECQYLKDVGCNMVRLHIKQNPRRWYTHCDRMGLLVWQDFVAAQTLRQNNNRVAIQPFQSQAWLAEQAELMDTLHNHPSILMWIVFNESWGQHNSSSILKWAMKRDPSRLFNVASGWFDLPGEGNIRDIHDYTFHPSIPVLGSELKRAVVLGECGGFASAVPPHNWTGRSNQTGEPANPLHGGFDPEIPRDTNVAHDIFRPTFTGGEPFEKQYATFIEDLCLLKMHGLTAAVYTQMTDMMLEENGWLTFDREVSKMDKAKMRQMHERLYQPVQQRKTIIRRIQPWEYTLLPPKTPPDQEQPVKFAAEPDFEDAGFQMGQAPFGNSFRFQCATVWDGKQRLVLRRPFTLDEIPKSAAMQFYTYLSGKPLADGSLDKQWQHARVYLNGKFVLDESTRLTDPEQRVSEVVLRPEILKELKVGENQIAIEIITALDPKRGVVGEIADEVYFDFSFFEIAAEDGE